VRSTISSKDFQDAEPDLLAHSNSAIIESTNETCLTLGIHNRTS